MARSVEAVRCLLVVVLLTAVISCATGPLSACSEEADGALDCSRQDLSGADLSGADLFGADLYKADLSGANLWGADLTQAAIWGAKASQNTIWPEGFDPVVAGVSFD